MKSIGIGITFFLAGSYAQYKLDQITLRKKIPEIAEKARKREYDRIVEVHNLHTQELENTIDVVTEMYTKFVDDEITPEELEARADEISKNLNMRMKFIKQIAVG